jgi:hypothetical protein
MAAPAPEVRAARGFLRSTLKAGTADIPPKAYANAAQELGLSLSGVAALLARLYAGGQGADEYREEALEANLRGRDP